MFIPNHSLANESDDHNEDLPLIYVGDFYTQNPSNILLHFSGLSITDMFLLYQQLGTNKVNLAENL